MKHWSKYGFLCATFIVSMLTIWTGLTFDIRTAEAADGSAYNGPHQVPGVIQAEDFNDGGQLAGYYATTPGNQGNSSYRSTDVDIYNDGARKYTTTSGVKEWLKYTINVSSAGWYRVDYNVKSSAAGATGIVTLIDDRQLGRMLVPGQADWTNVEGPQNVYLSTGTHILVVAFGNKDISMDYIEFSSVSHTVLNSPRIVSMSLNTDEVVVADAVVTDSPYNADSTGSADSTSAIQSALDAVWKNGGGTVVIPSGLYKLNGTLTVRENTTLKGDWKNPYSGGSGQGTILMASAGEDDADGTPFISMPDINSSIRDMSIWYPDQGYSAEDIHSYPYSISVTQGQATVTNITLYNSYNGIDASMGGTASTFGNIYGTTLKNGLQFGNTWEYAYVFNINIENSIWKNAPSSVITNAPLSNLDRWRLDDFTTEQRIGVQIGQYDGGQVYGISVKESLKDILIRKQPTDDHSFYGNLSKLSGDLEVEDTVSDVGYTLTDNVPEASSFNYSFASFRKPANSSNFYNVKLAPYSAAADGTTDDTSAIQNALTAAGQAGGGTVYLPAGIYKVTSPLTVPSGVELRGPYGAAHAAEGLDTCMINVYTGKDTAAPDTDTAFITLSADAGVRGFTIHYPEQGYGSVTNPVYRYPFAIRGDGSGIWVADMNLLNAYNGIDLKTNRSDDHLVIESWMTVLHQGIVVGGGSTGGVLERDIATYGNWYQSSKAGAPHQYGLPDLQGLSKNQVIPYKFYNSSFETSFGLDAFYSYTAFQFEQEGAGPVNYTLWQPSSDMSQYAGYEFKGGNNIKVIGMASGSNGKTLGLHADGYWMIAQPSFAGTVNIYGKYLWANSRGKQVNGGTVNDYLETNLLTEGPTIASGSTGSNGAPNAVDRNAQTQWFYNNSGTQWVDVDLGQISEINRWVVRNAETGGEPAYLNSRNIQLQKTLDNVNFDVIDGLENNESDQVDRNFTRTDTRYVKLVIYDGTQAGANHDVRINELALYGLPGWHFNLGTERWTAGNQISGMSASNGRLTFTTTGADPFILSTDNMGVDTNRFKKVKIKMKNGTDSTVGQLFFNTYSDSAFTEAKSAAVTTLANDALYTEYVFDLSANPAWTGEIKQLRFDPATTTGNIGIEYIMFVS